MLIGRRMRAIATGAVLAVATVTASAVTPAHGAVTVTADYQFQGRLAGCAGKRALTPYPGTSFATASIDGKSRRVLAWPKGSGFKLANTVGIMPNSSYTVVALFRFQEINGWKIIMDVKGSTGDDGFYDYSGQLQWYPLAKSAGKPIKANQWLQVAVSVSGGRIKGYVNGTKYFDVADPGGRGVVSSKNVASFFKDNVGVGSEHSAGAIARLRFYNGALSDTQIRALDRLPATNCP